MPPNEAEGFDYFEHTADVGIRAWGPTLEAAFGQAARGVIAHMVDLDDAKEVGELALTQEAESLDRLLFRFLEEVRYLFETRLFVISRAAVKLLPGPRLEARLFGEAYDAARHGHVHEIKAITLHGLSIEEDPPEVRVIVDI